MHRYKYTYIRTLVHNVRKLRGRSAGLGVISAAINTPQCCYRTCVATHTNARPAKRFNVSYARHAVRRKKRLRVCLCRGVRCACSTCYFNYTTHTKVISYQATTKRRNKQYAGMWVEMVEQVEHFWCVCVFFPLLFEAIQYLPVNKMSRCVPVLWTLRVIDYRTCACFFASAYQFHLLIYILNAIVHCICQL